MVLGIASLTAIIVIMCICCCRGRPEQPEKPLFYRDFLSMHDRRYIPLPGYNYGSTSYNVGPVQRLHSYVQPSVPFRYPYGYSSSSVPLIQQKVEIRCERPPPYDGWKFYMSFWLIILHVAKTILHLFSCIVL